MGHSVAAALLSYVNVVNCAMRHRTYLSRNVFTHAIRRIDLSVRILSRVTADALVVLARLEGSVCCAYCHLGRIAQQGNGTPSASLS